MLPDGTEIPAGPAEAPAPELPRRDPEASDSGFEVRFGDTVALANVSLSLHRGEIVTLIGPNGAGKTTLVRAILGLVKPSKGGIRRAPGLAIGYVPQRLAVDRVLPITVRRFLVLARRSAAADPAAALREVEAEDLLDRSLHALSGGEFQRVLLARALLRDPDLLVLDEPVQGVDFGGQIALYDLIGRIRRRHDLGVLMISHDLHIVMGATDRVVCLNRHVCCSGAPEAVSRHPEYAALFGPTAARRLAVYSHAHDHAHDVHGDVVPLPGTDRGATQGATRGAARADAAPPPRDPAS